MSQQYNQESGGCGCGCLYTTATAIAGAAATDILLRRSPQFTDIYANGFEHVGVDVLGGIVGVIAGASVPLALALVALVAGGTTLGIGYGIYKVLERPVKGIRNGVRRMQRNRN